MLHTIEPEVTFPTLPEIVKQGIANFLWYWEGRYPVYVVRTPAPRIQPPDMMTGIYYIDTGSRYDNIKEFWNAEAWINEVAKGTTTFNWDDVSVVNTTEDINVENKKEYKRHG